MQVAEPGGRVQQIPLEEDRGRDEASAGTSGVPIGRPTPATRRTLRLLVTTALVVVALVVGQGVLDARERSRLAALAALPGVLAPVDASVHELRRVAGEPDETLVGLGPVDGVAVLVVAPDEGTDAAVVGRDRQTWRLLWRHTVDPALADGTDVTCDALADGTHLLCTSWTGDATVADVLTAADGTLVRRFTVGADLLALTGLGVVSATASDDGTWVVTTSDPVTGAVRWRDELPARAGEGFGVRPGARDGFVLAATDSWARLYRADGTVVRDVTFPDTGYTQLGPRGTLLHIPSGRGRADDAPAATLVLADGTRLGVEDYLAPDPIGDAPDDVLLTTDTATGSLVVRDAATGAQWWRSDDVVQLRAFDVTSRLVAVGDVLVSATGQDVVAWDARTGRERWRVDDGRPVYLGTDGSDIVLVGGDGTVAALGTDGREAWRTGPGAVPEVGRIVVDPRVWDGLLVVPRSDGTLSFVGSD